MPKTGNINARVDDKLKANAEKVLRRVGVSTTDLVTMLLHQVVLNNGVPFEVKVPNKTTRKAMAELDAGKGKVFTGSGKELIDHLVGVRKKRKA